MEHKFDLSRKMDIGDIINASMSLYGKNFFYFIWVYAFYYLPFMVLALIFAKGMIGMYSTMMNTASMAQSNPFAFLKSYFLAIGLIVPAWIVLASMAHLSLVSAINGQILGQPRKAGIHFLAPLKRLVPVLVTTFIASLIFIAGMPFCFIPFFIFLIYLAFLPQVMMVEDKFYFRAIGRSFSATEKNFWQIALFLLVFSLAYGTISSIVTYGSMIGPYIQLFTDIMKNKGMSDPSVMTGFYSKYGSVIIIASVLNFLAYLVVTPVMHIGLTLKFHNIRNLKEGTRLINEIEKQTSGT
jgi:hypothetical protein